MVGKYCNPSCLLRFGISATGDCFGLKLTRDSTPRSPTSRSHFWLCESLFAYSDDRQDGLLLSRLGFSKAGRGTSAVFFG